MLFSFSFGNSFALLLFVLLGHSWLFTGGGGGMTINQSGTAAEQLEGVTLEGGWKVEQKIKRDPDATGSVFSVGYWAVNSDGRKAFLKALDFERSFKNSPDPARLLQSMTVAFNFERDLLAQCRNGRLDRVVVAVGDGMVTLPGAQLPVQYLLFERADTDMRGKLGRKVELAWKLRCLHHAATGLNQLHRIGVAHQDVKPSNVLVFPDEVSKLCDLGRASSTTSASPIDGNVIPGAIAYSPPELIYGSVPADWARRRFGCDTFMLGNLIVFMFTTANVGLMALQRLPDSLRPLRFRGTFTGTFESALPSIRSAYNDAFNLIEPAVRLEAPEAADELLPAIRQLCEPDPTLRGHPRDRTTDQHSMERYVSLLDRLARRAEIGLRP